MTVLGTITPDSPTVAITPGSQPVISFTVSVPAAFVYVGSDIQFSPSVPAGWTAIMDTTMTTSMAGIIVMDNYIVRYTITSTGTDTSGSFPLGLNYTINGLAAMYNDSFTSTSTETATIGVGAPPVPALDVVSDTGVLGDNITKNATPTITGTAEPNAVVKLYDTDGITELGSVTANGSGIWSITSTALSEGTHTLKVTQTALGSTSTLSAGLALTVDLTAPAAPSTPAMTAGTDTGASSADAITSNITPVFTGTGEIGATVTLYDTDGNTALGHATVNGSGKWSITSSTLAEGTHQVTVKQVDPAGNASAASTVKTVLIDTTAPVAPGAPALSTGSDSGVAGDLLTNVATPVVTGMAEGNAKVRLYDTDGTTLLGTTTADGTGKWSITSSTLGSGSHTLTVKQTDLAGNVSKASTGLTLEIDTSTPAAPGAPVLAAASDSGTAGDNRTNSTTPQFTGTGTSGDTVTLYDTDGTTVLGSAVVNGGKWSITS
ncbi:Ig-like domain-containing protein, partial [uncultured Massilia sp.]|uniref:Ig-like domain-containing protein n=1 Tax=uncultured Massilia sp. TaxID=169973 RepID=UPI0025E989F9